MLRSEYIKERQILMEEREEGRAEAAERRVAELERLLAAK